MPAAATPIACKCGSVRLYKRPVQFVVCADCDERNKRTVRTILLVLVEAARPEDAHLIEVLMRVADVGVKAVNG